jgi:hypothetical protein
MKRLCPAARLLSLELAADKATESYQRTRSHRARERMRAARTAAVKAGRK